MMVLCSFILFVLLLCSSTSHAADCGKVPIDFYVISKETLKGSVGIFPRSKLEESMKELRKKADKNIPWFNQKTQDRIGFCMGEFRVLQISDMQDFVPFNIDMEFWRDVEKAAKNGSVSPAQKFRAQKEVERICGFVRVITIEFLDYLGGGPVGHPIEKSFKSKSSFQQPLEAITQRQSKELPIKILIDGCSPGGSLGLKDTAIGMKRSESFGDLLFNINLNVVQSPGSSYQGLTLFSKFSTVEARKHEAPYMRNFRRGIQIFSLLSYDDTLLHEIGHYLGLPHVQDERLLPLSLPGRCPDNDAPPVLDTPGMPKSFREDYEDYFRADRSQWPKSCAPIRDPAGQIIDDKIPLDNYMVQGEDSVDLKLRFTEGQLKVMEQMVEMLVR